MVDRHFPAGSFYDNLFFTGLARHRRDTTPSVDAIVANLESATACLLRPGPRWCMVAVMGLSGGPHFRLTAQSCTQAGSRTRAGDRSKIGLRAKPPGRLERLMAQPLDAPQGEDDAAGPGRTAPKAG